MNETNPLSAPHPARYGLLGYPLGHSFSAGYFADKFAREHLCATYENFAFPTIEEAVEALRAQPGLHGFNVTIPYKQAILPYLHSLSPEAEALGAVNVVCVRRGADGQVRWHGCNSDLVGFTRSIRPLVRADVHRRALVLGTGGASRAVCAGLRALGIVPQYVSRRPAPGVLGYDALTPEILEAHKVIVNCTPVGMFPRVAEAPDIPYHLLTPEHLLYDLVYNPDETRFMALGKAQGAQVKNGLEMLHLQAEAAWEMWHEQP